ncbi:MAG: hypothetical protein M3Q95_15135 [Bacteroidota bacterium]|nr:hypothetical protein [Bacteroidota bacterium]
MIKSRGGVNTYVIASVIIALLLAGRGFLASGDFSYFFVAGTDFVDPTATPAPVWVQNGQGYDGQFFYRYALDPFNFNKTDLGITVDLVPYRMQRIMYPVLTWIVSFGGNPVLVPYALILVNVLAFFGILFFSNALLKSLNVTQTTAILPLLLCGIYMSLARDLSEVVELFFFTGSIYYLLRKSYFWFGILAACSILTRETSLVAYLPIVLITFFSNYKTGHLTGKTFFLFLPFFLFAVWKLVIASQTATAAGAVGSGNIGMPFMGMVNGFLGNLDVSSTKNQLQLLFWMLYFIWQIFVVGYVIRSIFYHSPATTHQFFNALAGAYLSWFGFALILSPAIYIDDWSFVRVFSLWNMTGFLLLYICNRPVPDFFRYYSVLLVGLTLVRLIIRP